jgi:hypothetical protein
MGAQMLRASGVCPRWRPPITAPSTPNPQAPPLADNGPPAVALTPGRCPGTNTTGLTTPFSPQHDRLSSSGAWLRQRGTPPR